MTLIDGGSGRVGLGEEGREDAGKNGLVRLGMTKGIGRKLR